MIWILLPAYNEEDSLSTLLPKIDHALRHANRKYKLLVCDDGSTDGTAQQLRELRFQCPMEILTHPRNRGLGETSRDLFERAAELCEPNDIIIRMDCDDTHDPITIINLAEKLEEGFDVVIASRFQAGGAQRGVVPYRAVISRCANLFMKVFFPIRGVREYSCGFRAYRANLIKAAIEFYGNDFIQLKGLGFTCTLEKLIKLRLLGARFAEVPFVLRYDLKRSASKMVSSITTVGYLTMALLYHWPWGGWRRNYRNKPKPDFRPSLTLVSAQEPPLQEAVKKAA